MKENQRSLIFDLNQLITRAAQAAQHASGVQEGLAMALAAVEANMPMEERLSNLELNQLPGDDPATNRRQVQQPVIDTLKTNGPLTVTEIIAIGHENGHDLQRPAVSEVLKRLMKRDLVSKDGHKFQLKAFT